MGRLIIEIMPAAGGQPHLHVFDRVPVFIGRGYGNDVILQDPYISPKEALIFIGDDGKIVVEDIGGANGIFIGEAKRRKRDRVEGRQEIPSGTMLTMGQTVMRILSPDHAVEPVQYLSHKSKGARRSLLKGSLLPWYAVIGFLLILFVEGLQQNPMQDSQLGVVIFGVVVALLIVMLWAGIWAFWGRIFRNRAWFRMHLTIICVFTMISFLFSSASFYIGVFFMNPLVEFVCMIVLMGGSAAGLLFAHLTCATRLNWRSRIITAAAVPALCVVIAVFGQSLVAQKFSLFPPYYARLKPLFVRPFRVFSIDEHAIRISRVFEEAKKIAVRK